ncbi:Methyltransferase domain-containing protein [Cladophialophora immunda]|nr:Methyltransferase domain-containing protein [Cladophialophora immunda]
MTQSQLDVVKSMYDERSEQYDENDVHVRQARDYIAWADLKNGENVLDLACGTGLVAIGAKQVTGSSGRVVGVDISEGMLNVARRKAQAAGLDIAFFNHDVSDLTGLEFVPQASEDGGLLFDVITCASALILLPDPLQAVKNWKAVLRPGRGRLITDVQTKDANVVMNIFSAVAPQVGETVPWHSHLWQSQQALAALMADAGFRVERVFETEAYARAQYHLDAAAQLFDKAVSKAMFKDFGRAEIRERAKELFVRKFAEVAGPKGIIEEETRYWVIVATKPG